MTDWVNNNLGTSPIDKPINYMTNWPSNWLNIWRTELYFQMANWLYYQMKEKEMLLG